MGSLKGVYRWGGMSCLHFTRKSNTANIEATCDVMMQHNLLCVCFSVLGSIRTNIKTYSSISFIYSPMHS